MKFRAYIIDNKDDADDDVSLELCKLKDYASSPHLAWKNFLSLVGKDRHHWNKLGYISRPVQIEITFEDKQ